MVAPDGGSDAVEGELRKLCGKIVRNCEKWRDQIGRAGGTK